MIQDSFYYCPIMGLQYSSLQVDYNRKKMTAIWKMIDLSKTPVRKTRGRPFKTQHKE